MTYSLGRTESREVAWQSESKIAGGLPNSGFFLEPNASLTNLSPKSQRIIAASWDTPPNYRYKPAN